MFEPCEGGPLTGAAPDESQLSDNAGKLAVGSAGTQVKSRFGASFLVGSESNVWQSGLRAAGHNPSLGQLQEDTSGSWQCRNAGKVKVWS